LSGSTTLLAGHAPEELIVAEEGIVMPPGVIESIITTSPALIAVVAICLAFLTYRQRIIDQVLPRVSSIKAFGARSSCSKG